jgi:hypothetical protein
MTMTVTKRRGITVEVFPWQGISIQLQAGPRLNLPWERLIVPTKSQNYIIFSVVLQVISSKSTIADAVHRLRSACCYV